MKLHCRIAFYDRTLSYNKSRQKSILTFARKTAECPDPYLYWQIIGKPRIEKYEIINNIEQIFFKYVKAGKATIQFKRPCHDLIIQSEEIMHLKIFLNILYQIKKDGKIAIKHIPIFNPCNNAKFLKLVKKVVINEISKYPVLNGFPKTTQELSIIGLNRKSFDRQILQLQSLRVLDLSRNSLIFLPKELGTLPNLENLNLSYNCFGLAPISKWEWLEQSAIKNKLTNLEINHNQLKELPMQVGKLKVLVRLSVCNNLLTELPQNIGNLQSLNFLFLSNNKLRFLPGTIKYLRLQFLNISKNLFTEYENETKEDFSNIQWLSLEELAAKVILQFRLLYNVWLPNILTKYLDDAKYCYKCRNACFGSYIRTVCNFHPNMIALECQWTEKYIKLDCYFCSQKCFYGKW